MSLYFNETFSTDCTLKCRDNTVIFYFIKSQKAFEFISKKYKKIDMLINNAGYGISGATELISDQDTKKLFDVNFFGALNCMRYALPLMDRNSKIFNIASACAIFPLDFAP